jgi:DNA end-binding protein Ku
MSTARTAARRASSKASSSKASSSKASSSKASAKATAATAPKPASRARPQPANETGQGGRAMWTGSIGFGLVQIPVRLFPRERTNDLAFHQVDKRDGSLIGYERINKSTHKAVEWADIAKAYELAKGQYVIVTDEDFEKANVAASQTIEVQDFVPASAIPVEYFDRPYFAMPDKRGGKAYAVMRDAMAKKGLAAVGYVVLRTRQHLCAVIAEGDLLLVELLRFPHELRPAREVGGTGVKSEASTKELQLAEQLIDRMVVDWDPSQYKDSYRDELLDAIRHKAETGTLEPRNVPEKPGRQPLDLVALLEQSVAGAKGKKATAGAKKRAKRAA